MHASEEPPVLSSWKDIARYVGKGVRTVQRWENHLGLPVRRSNGPSRKGTILLERRDLDAWLAMRFSTRSAVVNLTPNRTTTLGSACSGLREGIQTARTLRRANLALSEKILESIRQLTEQCDRFRDPLRSSPPPRV